METINFVIVLGFILTWFLIITLSKQVKKNRDMIMTGMLAASKYLDKKITNEVSEVRLYTKVDVVNEIIEYLKLSTYEETDSIKVDYIRQALKDFLNEYYYLDKRKHKEE